MPDAEGPLGSAAEPGPLGNGMGDGDEIDDRVFKSPMHHVVTCNGKWVTASVGMYGRLHGTCLLVNPAYIRPQTLSIHVHKVSPGLEK